MTESRRSYAFVLPRYWPGIAGGAETLGGELAQKLADRGDHVEILTTCAKDNRSWENALPPGEERSGNLVISRFKVDPRDLERWIPLQIAVSHGLSLSVEDELAWMQHSVNSTGLYREIASRGQRFDLLFFAPYLFGTTFWGSQILPERSVLIPCLHDEHYAYTEVIRSMFRLTSGALFNAEPERDLAERLYGPLTGAEVGMGFDFERYEGEGRPPFFKESFPYLLYVGRKETGKNAHLLIDFFIAGKEAGQLPADLKLVIVGGGSFSDLLRPKALERGDIVDVAHVSEEEKQALMQHALLLAQPSTNESFSIVLMESWLLGTPVLVHAACAVTREHVVQSGGGLYFSDVLDFTAAVKEVAGNAELRSNLARCGGSYVRRRYSWAAVLERFDDAVERILDHRRTEFSEARQ